MAWNGPPGMQQGGPTQEPWDPYGYSGRGGWTNRPGSNETWWRDHSLDPTTGVVQGPWPVPPADIAMGVQGLHDRGVWQFRQRLMSDAVNSARSASGLLQSFRPGGGAAIESGIYSQIAGLQMQRAQQTQPLDYLSDYRRHQDAISRQRANRAAERQLAVQIAGTVAAIGATVATGGAAAPAAMAGLAGLAGYYSGQNAASAGSGGGYSSQSHYVSPEQASVQPSPSGGPTGPQAPMIGPMQSSGPMGGGGGIPQGGSGPTTLQSQNAPQGGPGGPQGGQSPMGGQGQGAGAMGAPAGAPGSDGNFGPIAYAASAAGSQAMQNPIARVAMSNTVANMVEESGLIQALSYAADRALAMRIAG
jgi:hypothetical protein